MTTTRSIYSGGCASAADSSAAPDPKERDIPQCLNELGHTVDRLEQVLGGLIGRLEPVLIDRDIEKTGNPDCPRTVQSPIGQGLTNITERIGAVANRIEVLERVVQL